MTTPRHSLSEKDPVTRRATCSLCGPVKIQKSGNGWACSTRANAQSRKQKAKNPDRDRSSKTEHVLTWKDPVTRTGVCAKCEAVTIVPWGRGFACPNGEAAKQRTNFQDKPATYCDACKILDARIVWLTADGCPRCNETDLNAMFAKDAATERLLEGMAEEFGGGFMITGPWEDPYAMPELENAVPGWKTIGTR